MDVTRARKTVAGLQTEHLHTWFLAIRTPQFGLPDSLYYSNNPSLMSIIFRYTANDLNGPNSIRGQISREDPLTYVEYVNGCLYVSSLGVSLTRRPILQIHASRAIDRTGMRVLGTRNYQRPCSHVRP